MAFFLRALPILLGLPLVATAATPSPALAGTAAPESEAVFKKTITPLLEKYCYECHGDGANKGKVTLDEGTSIADILKNRTIWEGVLRNVRTHEMPPADDTDFLPTQTERDAIVGWLEKELFHFDPENPDPGKVTLRRLNRAEYNATIRDLVGVDFKPAEDFPPDDSGYGFDNVADVLSLPPVLLEKYLAAADKIFDQAIVTDPIKTQVKRVPATMAEVGFNAVGDRGDGWIQLISLEEDDVAVPLNLPAGDYMVRVHAFSTRDGGALVGQGSEKKVEFAEDPGPTKIALLVNDAFVQDFEVTRDEANPGVYEARVGVPSGGRQYFRAGVRRKRGGDENELYMLNGRLGRQQPGIVYVKWIEVEGPLNSATRRYRAGQLEATGEGANTTAGDRKLLKNGEVVTTVELARESEVILRAQAYAQQAGTETAKMAFRINGEPLKTFEVLAPATMQPLPGQRVFSLSLLVPQPRVYEVKTKLPAGKHRFAAAFVNDFEDLQNKNPNLRDRNLVLQNVEVSVLGEPVLVPPMPEPLFAVFAKHGAAPAASPVLATGTPALQSPPTTETARAILTDFSRRAWRGPVAPSEVDRLLKLYAFARAQGDSFEAGVKLAMKAILVSPHFLFIGESREPVAATPKAVPIDEVTLASRLSYFLWSSMPDDELLGLAEQGELRKNLTAQVKRMLASPKAISLVENFAGQWLQIRSLETFQPDKKLFPEFDPVLRTAMQRETELFFENIMREDRSVFDFLTADYTFVNARLARFYGLPEVKGEEFERVSLVNTPRRGVLTHASILTLTSNPTRTSPVKRGLWVLENLLGTPPPPPPPNVPELDDEKKLAGSLRQQMEQHRANPSCSSCHARMDPIGFGLENFNAIGVWRDKDGEALIDPSGKLTTGDTFAGAGELVSVLANKRSQEFRHCLAEKMLTYALGRGTEYFDRPALEKIVQAMAQNQDKFSSLVHAVTESFPFQMRRGQPVTKVAQANP